MLCLSLFQWAYELGQASEMKVSVPLHGCEHFYLLTKPFQEQLPLSTPGLRHQTHIIKMNFFSQQAQLVIDFKFYSYTVLAA